MGILGEFVGCLVLRGHTSYGKGFLLFLGLMIL